MTYTTLPILLAFLSCFICNTTSNAQFIKAIVPIGINFTQVDGDQIAGYNKVGLQTGVGALIDLNETETWEVGFELLYNRLGSKSSSTQIGLQGFDLKLLYDYVSIPLLVNYKDVGKGYLGAGVVISRLVNNKRFEDGIEVPNAPTKTKSMDIAVMGQAGFVFTDNFRLTLRVGYSILPFEDPRTFHNYVSIRFDTILNGLIKL